MRAALRWLPALVALAAYDVYLLLCRLAEVQGNVEAQFIIITPGLIASHLLHRHRSDRQYAEQVGRSAALAAQVGVQQQELAAHRADMAAVAEQVGEIHALHLHGRWPEDRHQSR
ncbi:hypothetical protein [Streptacidiphilus cavernicola]|uniref:Uncharacterized protein n=1 Tax=Streptacidiphilus cavernicola TaxID=3342716 RepID=A0ABV6VXV2_9ACTN